MKYDPTIKLLKNDGHKLLEEYIQLDSRKGIKFKRNHAYGKLAKKVKNGNPVHFAQMTTIRELKEAIIKLKKMIKTRKQKLAWENRFGDGGEVKVAPNVRELQKLASELNIREIGTKTIHTLGQLNNVIEYQY